MLMNGCVAVKARRNQVVMCFAVALGPKPIVVVMGSPYPSGAAPVAHDESSKDGRIQVGFGATPVSRYRQVLPGATSVSSVRKGPVIS